jgi:two-component system, OmpR family, response regulator QseB
MLKILFLEDDVVLAATVVDFLEDEGFDVKHISNGEEALDATFDEKFDLYIFDVNVPMMNGFELLKSLREADDNTPTFFITALTDIASVGEGFAVGADDYIKKPFDPDELIIRIKAKLQNVTKSLTLKDLKYDPQSKTLTKNDETVDLSEIQQNLFHLFITHLGQTVDKVQCLDLLDQPSDQALRVHINKLKNRLDLDLVNVRGVGYRLEQS